MTNEKTGGLIYILTNPSFPNYVKIGKTTRDVQQRIKELNNPTCLPFTFRVYAIYKVEKNLDSVEKAIHNLIDKIDYDLRAREELDSRKLREREFFALDAENAFEILKEIAVLRDDENNLQKIRQTNQEKVDEQIAQVVEEHSKMRSRWNLSQYGLEIGEELTLDFDRNIKARVLNDKEIQLVDNPEQIGSLSGIGWDIYQSKGKKSFGGGPYVWLYNGKRLWDIRLEKEKNRILSEITEN